jgi:hypothetical protein
VTADPVFQPAKVARRTPQPDPGGKCMEVISTAGNHLTWCPKPQDPDTPDARPRCTKHKDPEPADYEPPSVTWGDYDEEPS